MDIEGIVVENISSLRITGVDKGRMIEVMSEVILEQCGVNDNITTS